MLQGREISLIIDETGDRKKGNKTDFVKRQYIGNLGKVENGIVAVTAYLSFVTLGRVKSEKMTIVVIVFP